MKKLKQISLIVLISTMALIGCSKDKVKGCTDADSTNYNSKAEEDDGSCVYEGSIVIWYNQVTADSLLVNGATALTYYVDGVVVGSSAASVYWTSSPNCGQSSSITVSKNLGSVKSKSFTYSIQNQSGYEHWTGTVNFIANTCTQTQLTY